MSDIQAYIEDGDKGIYYHGYLSKQEVSEELKKYDLSIIPLAAAIHGAVPSKIFDLLPEGIPILFSGEGEGARIVDEYGFGLVSAHGDYVSLSRNIRTFVDMSDGEYARYVGNCLEASRDAFSFDKQMGRFCEFINK